MKGEDANHATVKILLAGQASESEVQAAICDYFATERIFFVRLNNIPSFFIGSDGTKQYRKLGKYARKGMSDILAIMDGRAIFIEMKREGEQGAA